MCQYETPQCTVSELSGLATVKKNIYHSFHFMPKIHKDLQNLLLVITAELRTVENDDISVTKSNL